MCNESDWNNEIYISDSGNDYITRNESDNTSEISHIDDNDLFKSNRQLDCFGAAYLLCNTIHLNTFTKEILLLSCQSKCNLFWTKKENSSFIHCLYFLCLFLMHNF